MRRGPTITEIVTHTFTARCVEPVKRIKVLDHVPRGCRHLPVRPTWIVHTYPIKGGVTRMVIMNENISRGNKLFEKFRRAS